MLTPLFPTRGYQATPPYIKLTLSASVTFSYQGLEYGGDTPTMASTASAVNHSILRGQTYIMFDQHLSTSTYIISGKNAAVGKSHYQLITSAPMGHMVH